MFRNVFIKSLRDYRWAILGWSAALGLTIYAYYATILSQLAGTNGATLQNVAGQFSFFGETVEANTPGGYITFKIMGSVPVILGIWTLLAGARMTRGEEDRGAMDILLSTPQSRLSLIVQKILALAAATGLISVIVGLLTLAGMASAKAKLPAEVTVDPGNALMAGINAGVAAFLFGALALLLAQFMARGAAAGWTGVLMVFFFVLEGTGRSIHGASGIRPFTPLYYYDQSLPLVPDHAMNWGAFAVLVALCVILAGAAVPLFLRRDVGRSVLADVQLGQAKEVHARPAGQVLAHAERDTWLRGIGLQAARQQRTAVFWWIVALAIFAGFLVYIAKSFEKQVADLIGNSTTFEKLFSGANLGTNNGFLSAVVFPYVTLLVPIFAVFIAYRWPTDLDNGRLELTLSTPHSRWRVILERYGAVFAAAVLATVVIWLAIVFAAFASNLTIDAGNIAVATFGMLPLELITASLVFALAGLLPPALVIGIMAVFLAASFLAELLRTLLSLPDWVLNFSMFHQYGTPVLTGLSWGAFVGMLIIAAALLAIGGWQFSSRDLDRGVVEA